MGVELGQIDKREFTLGAIDNKQINIGSGSIIRLPLELPSLEKTVVPTKETQVVNKESGYELTKVTVEPIPDNFIEPTGVFEIEENGEYDITEYKTLVSNVPAREDLDAELNEQDALLNELNSKIDELPDREIDLSLTTATVEDVAQGKQFYNAQGQLVEGVYMDTLQHLVDAKKSCYYLFYKYPLEIIPYLSRLDTSNVTDMSYMFYECKATSLDVSNFDTSNVTNMYSTFSYCEKVTILDLSSWDTRNVTNMSSMFYTCADLKSVIGTIDMIKCSNASNIISTCYDLENITFKNIKVYIWLYSSKIKNESVINTFKELWDNTGNALGGSRRLDLSTQIKTNIANIYVKLIEATDEMRAEDPYIDNKKPCVVCESTDEGAMTLTEYAILKNWAIS